MAGKNYVDRLDHVVAEARAARAEREKGYRDQALKLFPWVCGRCGREFTHKNVSQLTVHHKDHNHDNNPPDGSNWELLCLYCHDHEHARFRDAAFGDVLPEGEREAATYHPFADLGKLLKDSDRDD